MGEESVIRFLIASDVHAGYGENKPFIGNDTFDTLREVLTKASETKVDFILMAGDLFHENHPTRDTQLKTVRLLRKFCLGKKTSDLEFASDPTINFEHSNFPVVNYLDPNLHISMPIFTIHGNHDDLSGKGLSALDVFHETGLLNLFGKFCDVDQIEVSPILLQRGNTKIALYGIGSQRDDRLARAFAKGRVKFNRPEDSDSWFSILVLHQNKPPRSKLRSTKSHLSYKSIPTFFDIVIWGHEHECLIDPDKKFPDPNYPDDDSKSFYIIQPGSTVATSLSTEESKEKHIGIMSVRGKEFLLDKIQLQTTRQVIIDDLVLETKRPAAKIPRSSIRQKGMPDEPLIEAKIEQMLKEAEAKRGPQQPYPPRVRLKVLYSGKWLDIPPINGRRFGAKFTGRVANANEMIFVRMEREKNVNVKESLNQVLEAAHTADDVLTVDEMVNTYFKSCNFKSRLSVLSEVSMEKQLQEYSNTETNTQYKYTDADKAMTENIKEQINKLSKSVKEIIANRIEQSIDANEPLDKQIVDFILTAKRERLLKSAGSQHRKDGNSTLNETEDTMFMECSFDPSHIVTSTPRPSQERELHQHQQRSDQSTARGQQRQMRMRGMGMMEGDMDTTVERDFSPSP